MRTKILPDPVLDLLRRSPLVYQAARQVRMGIGGLVPPRRFEGVPGRIHFNDFMLASTSDDDVASYVGSARNAMSVIERGLQAASLGFGDVERWLDFGCGYGRVLRLLTQRVDPGRVYVTDVIQEGVEFCVSEFGVHAVPAAPSLEALEVSDFGAVYAISVLTHMDEASTTEMLRLMRRALAVGGLIVFTTHGHRSVERIDRYYGGSYVDDQRRVATAVEGEGMAFIPYRHYRQADYGMAWHAPRFIEHRMRHLHGDTMRLLLHQPHGYDDHQDVFTYQRAS